MRCCVLLIWAWGWCWWCRHRNPRGHKASSIGPEKRADLVCLAEYMRLLSPAFVRAFPHRILNIHPSWLPAFPGLDAQNQALEYGAKVTGCTVHFVDDELDHGPIVVQRTVPVLE